MCSNLNKMVFSNEFGFCCRRQELPGVRKGFFCREGVLPLSSACGLLSWVTLFKQSLYRNVMSPPVPAGPAGTQLTFLRYPDLQRGSADAWSRGTSRWSPLALVPVGITVPSVDLSCIQNDHLGVKKSTACCLGSLVPTQCILNILNELSFWPGLTWRFKDGGNNETMMSRQRRRSEGLSAGLFLFFFSPLCLVLSCFESCSDFSQLARLSS